MAKVKNLLSHPVFVIALILLIDQWVKVWIKTHMYLGEEFAVLGDWFIIHFTENNGMAFGMEFGGEFGKLFLSVFRILAVGGIGYFLFKLYKEKAPKGVILSFSLIFAGAVGNIIDSVFYGVIFNESYSTLAELFPPEGGYSGFMHGKVVDMLYFPIIEGYYPDWFPFWANERFIFFRPVFNIADSAITAGVLIILIFNRDFFTSEKTENPSPEEVTTDAEHSNTQQSE